MATGPTIDISEDWEFFDNKQDVTLVLPDGRSSNTVALQDEIGMAQVEVADGALGFRQFCTWRLFRKQLDGLVPILNAYVQDSNGQRWYIRDPRILAWGTAYVVTCTLEGGETTPELVLPSGSGSGPSGLLWGGSGQKLVWG